MIFISKKYIKYFCLILKKIYVKYKCLELSKETPNLSSQLFVINPKNAGELKLLSTLAT